MDWRSTGYRVGKDWVVRKDLPGEVTFEQNPWWCVCVCVWRELQLQGTRSEKELRGVIKEQKESQLGGE